LPLQLFHLSICTHVQDLYYRWLCVSDTLPLLLLLLLLPPLVAPQAVAFKQPLQMLVRCEASC
jgi:hypothetical protein